MGVKDLITWIKKTHPTALVSFPKRWAAPEIKGKRIAIDATLLTNRYHFAITDGPLRGKGALVGWYNLMRAHDIQPVAIWDRLGVREWKAVEHEDDRQERLSDLKDGFAALQALSEEEQEAVRQAWSAPPSVVESSVSPSSSHLDTSPDIPPAVHAPTPPPPEIIPSPIPPTPTSSPSPDPSEAATAESLERITTVQETLLDIVSRFQSSLPSTPRQTRSPEFIDDVVIHLSELEQLSDSLDAGRTRKDDEEWLREKEEAKAFLDERAGELLPVEGFSETKRQSELSLEEGRIIEEVLGLKGSGPAEDAATSQPASATPTPPDPPLDPFDRLEALIEAAPPVRDIYERALFVPTPETHADCRNLLGRLGVPILFAEAPYEAEGMATSLALSGVVDWVGSEDSDVIALGNVSTAGLPLVSLPSAPLLALTSLTRTQFTDFCILLGNDACPRIPGFGPVNSYKQIVKHGSIEAILEKEEKARGKVPDIEEYMEMVRTAREVFASLPPISDEVKRELEVSFEGMKEAVVDMEGVERWLEERHGIRFVSPGEAIE